MTLVLADQHACPCCRRTLIVEIVRQDPLLRHAGYGATMTSTCSWCGCGYYRTDITTERPPR